VKSPDPLSLAGTGAIGTDPNEAVLTSRSLLLVVFERAPVRAAGPVPSTTPCLVEGLGPFRNGRGSEAAPDSGCQGVTSTALTVAEPGGVQWVDGAMVMANRPAAEVTTAAATARTRDLYPKIPGVEIVLF
jgi:hypothetical protein